MKILKFPAVIVAALFGFLTLFAGEEWTGVVKIFAVSSPPNYFLPWQNFSQQSGSGTGFVIDGNRIITNAHVISGGKSCWVALYTGVTYEVNLVGFDEE